MVDCDVVDCGCCLGVVLLISGFSRLLLVVVELGLVCGPLVVGLLICCFVIDVCRRVRVWLLLEFWCFGFVGLLFCCGCCRWLWLIWFVVLYCLRCGAWYLLRSA